VICFENFTFTLGVHRAQVRYWFLKAAIGKQFRGQSVGGRRKGTFDVGEKPIVHEYLVQYFAAFPKSTLQNAADELTAAFNRSVGKKVNVYFSL
jgi:hypothetical protein